MKHLIFSLQAFWVILNGKDHIYCDENVHSVDKFMSIIKSATETHIKQTDLINQVKEIMKDHEN